MDKIESALVEIEKLDPTSEEYREAVARLLNRLDPKKPAGTTLCNAVMRFWPSLAFEAVAIRMRNQGPEVFLRRRAAHDTAYPGMWHAPGSLYRHGEDHQQVAGRLEREFGTGISIFEFCGQSMVNEERGTVYSLVFLVVLKGSPRIDDHHKWVRVDLLQLENMVPHHHYQIIPMAFHAWQRHLCEGIGW